MKLLLDQNLSRRLVPRLMEAFPGSVHVSELGLETATDHEIWDHAEQNDFVIASKDSDFRQLAFLLGPPPKVIWLRVGNAPTSRISELLSEHVETITSFGSSPDEALLVLPGFEQ